MAKNTKALSSIVYTEWLIPLLYYSDTLKANEKIYEMGLPAAVSLLAACLYQKAGKIAIALDALAELLPSVVSILIGFTVLFITLILSNDTPGIQMLKTTRPKEKIQIAAYGGKEMSLYQVLHIQLTEALVSENVLLLIVFGYLFYKGLWTNPIVEFVMLVAEVYFTLHILLGIVRNITNLHFLFFADANNAASN